MITEAEFGWLGGIIDGEGCFCISHNNQGRYVPVFKIPNTNPIIIERSQELLRKLGIPWIRTGTTRHDRPQAKDCMEINVSTNKGILLLCRAMKPYIFGNGALLKLYKSLLKAV